LACASQDFASKGHEYFDVWSPEIATTYGENYWTSMGDHPLPDAIVQRFKGKVMAITGYEQDQVMVDPVGQPGVHPERDLSVPINWAYNHHYMNWMTGAHSEMKEVAALPGDTSAHGAPTKWVAVEKPSAASRSFPDAPTSLLFSEGNGGESRKSFHGYPHGFAQLIESPNSWHLTPMQIVRAPPPTHRLLPHRTRHRPHHTHRPHHHTPLVTAPPLVTNPLDGCHPPSLSRLCNAGHAPS
jgi:hypothetical protein